MKRGKHSPDEKYRRDSFRSSSSEKQSSPIKEYKSLHSSSASSPSSLLSSSSSSSSSLPFSLSSSSSSSQTSTSRNRILSFPENENNNRSKKRLKPEIHSPSAEASPPKKKRKGSTRDDIHFEDLCRLFMEPLENAASVLRISPSYLKTLCRRHGISKWPYRRIAKIDRLIDDVTVKLKQGHFTDTNSALQQIRYYDESKITIVEKSVNFNLSSYHRSLINNSLENKQFREFYQQSVLLEKASIPFILNESDPNFEKVPPESSSLNRAYHSSIHPSREQGIEHSSMQSTPSNTFSSSYRPLSSSSSHHKGNESLYLPFKINEIERRNLSNPNISYLNIARDSSSTSPSDTI